MIDHGRARVLEATAFDFDLFPDDRRQLDEHLADCVECRRFGERLRADQTAAGRRPLSGLPDRVSVAVASAAGGSGSNARPTVRPRALIGPLAGVLAWLIAAVVIGATLLAVVGTSRPGPDRTSPQVTVPPSPVTSPLGSVLSLPPAPGGPLAAGTYAIGSIPGSVVTITLPTGWTNGGDNGAANEITSLAPLPMSAASLSVVAVDNLYVDPCHWERGRLDPKLGPTANDLTTALEAQWPAGSTTSRDVTIGGHVGKFVEMTVPDDATSCTNGVYRTMVFPDTSDVVAKPGTHTRLWIVDVPAGRLVISATDHPETTEAERSQLQQIVNSVRIDGRA